MKNIKILICILISLQLNSQITLENTYPASSNNVQATLVKLTKSGYKYVFSDIANKTIKLYNTNHTIFKSMFIPVPGGYSIYQAPSLISDSLFNTDANIEFAVTFFQSVNSTTPTTYNTIANVVSENGTLLLTINQCKTLGAFNTGGNGYKLICYVDSTNKLQLKEHRIYSLVGAIGSINNGNGLPTNTTQLDKQSSTLSNPYPNPSQNKTVIPYQLPLGTQAQLIVTDISGKELKRYDIDSNFNTVELDNSDLPSGTYFYSISGTNEAKKMVIIH